MRAARGVATVMATVMGTGMTTTTITTMMTTMTTPITMATAITPMADTDLPTPTLLRLMTWLSPSFPVGAFSYSHGLEYAVEAGLVRDGEQLTQWVEAVVLDGAGRLDADLLRNAWNAATADDEAAIADTIEWGNALRGTAEMALEAGAQGKAFLKTVHQAWMNGDTNSGDNSGDTIRISNGDPYCVPGIPGIPASARWWHTLAAENRDIAYPVAVGFAGALARLDLQPVLAAYLHGFAANLVSAGIRLVPLGQTDGQRAMARLEPVIEQAVAASLARAPEDLGAAAPIVDLMSIAHETQYTRLYRS